MTTPEIGRSTLEEVRRSPHAIVASAPDTEQARALIEELESNGVPDTAIALVAVGIEKQSDPNESIADSEAFSDLFMAVIRGGFIWGLGGVILGVLVSTFITDLSWAWGGLFGFLFGAAVGGAYGGMTVARYNSPAWTETYEITEVGDPSVGVHHRDQSVVDLAQDVLQQRVHAGQLTRYRGGEVV